jgi:glucuronate isomerase
MKEFFGKDVLLEGESAKALYEEVKDLPIIDYHCHLDQEKIASDGTFENIGQLWLAGDHYKWRAMRMCGVDEHYITGDASWEEKFAKYAEILPQLIGGPLYYWTHLELQQVFGIRKPLNKGTAAEIYKEANEKIKKLSVRKLLKMFRVEYVATTNDPLESLESHGKYDNTTVAPTFRPDKLYNFDSAYIAELGKAAGIQIVTLNDLKKAICARLDHFVAKGCRISDHGFLDFPKTVASEEFAEFLFESRETLNADERDSMFGYILLFLLKEYKKRNIIVQLHFSVTRNINKAMFKKVGVDAGYDVIAEEPNLYATMKFLDKLTDEERPTIILYTLNPNAIAPLACISGAFRNVYIGAAWWFNDTLNGIKNNLTLISEYACLGTNLGMLTDSRSFSSYSRFDFFRRILCSFVGEKVDKGEYDEASAKELVKNISYYNIKKLLNI